MKRNRMCSIRWFRFSIYDTICLDNILMSVNKFDRFKTNLLDERPRVCGIQMIQSVNILVLNNYIAICIWGMLQLILQNNKFMISGNNASRNNFDLDFFTSILTGVIHTLNDNTTTTTNNNNECKWAISLGKLIQLDLNNNPKDFVCKSNPRKGTLSLRLPSD